MEICCIKGKRSYPDSEAGVRTMLSEDQHGFEIERIERPGGNIWNVHFPDGSGTRAFPALGLFEQPPISHVMKTLGPLRDPDAVPDFLFR